MKQFLLPAFFALIPVLSFAQSADSVQHIDLDTITVAAEAGPAVYRAASPLVWDIVHTRIALSFDRQKKTAAAREWIKMHPYAYATDTIVLDAKGMAIDSVLLVAKGGNKPLTYSYAGDELKVHFGKEYKPTDTVELYLRYTAMPYAASGGGSGAITEDRGLYFINTDNQDPHKPAHIWTQGETESNSHWMITVDKPNNRFTTQVELTIPDSLVTLSNGALVKQVKETNGMRTDIWKMDKAIQAYAVMFAIGKYAVIRDKWNNKEVNYYVEPAYAADARLMFAHTTEMLDFFSKKTGVSYPWNKYSQVVVRDYVSGAMENTTASLFGEFVYQTPREMADHNSEDVVSHELFHQWFGDYVSCESWSNLTVSESFANYGEQLWRRYKYGNTSADQLAWNDLQIYIYSSKVQDPPLVRFHYDDREEMFDGISYNKGGAVLHYLNTLIGDAAFEKAMQLYLSQNALGAAEAQKWRLAVEEATGQDWNWFFDQWYYHAGHPILKVTYNYNDTTQTLNVEVAQAQDDSALTYRLLLKTAVIYGNERQVADWNLTKRTQKFTFPYKNGQRPLIIPDCLHVLPGELKENKKAAQWYAQLQSSQDYVSKRLAVAGAGKQMSDSTAQVLLDRAMNDTMAAIRQLAIDQVGNASSDRYRKRWTAAIIHAATTDKDRHVRAEAFDVLGKWKVSSAKQAMIDGLRDSSYAVAGNALEALDRIDKDTAYLLATQLLKAKPGGALRSEIWTLVGKKGADDDIAFYQETAPFVYGSSRLSLAGSLSNYLKNVTSDRVFREAAYLLATMAITETRTSYRSSIAGYMLQAVAEQKSKQKSTAGAQDDKEVAARATTRLNILKAALQKVTDAETDAEQKKKFEKKMKDNFE